MNGVPRIDSVKPGAALPGGEIALAGSGFGARNHTRPQVQFGTSDAVVMLASENRLIARVPENASEGGADAGEDDQPANGCDRTRHNAAGVHRYVEE